MSLPWSAVDIPNVTPLRKTDFPSPSRYHLGLVSCLAVGLHACFSSSMLGFCLDLPCAGLLRTVAVSVSSYVSPPCCVWKMLSFYPFFLIDPRDLIYYLRILWPMTLCYLRALYLKLLSDRLPTQKSPGNLFPNKRNMYGPNMQCDSNVWPPHVLHESPILWLPWK